VAPCRGRFSAHEVKNGHRLVDPTGLYCARDDEAKRQAGFIASQIAQDVPASIKRRVTVFDEEGREVTVLEAGQQPSWIGGRCAVAKAHRSDGTCFRRNGVFARG
jgi:hypothetical protein